MNMLKQDDFDRMDWLSYGYDQRRAGYAEGETEGEVRGKIIGTVETMRDDGKSDSEIVKRIMSKYELPRDKAEEYVV